MTAQEDNGSVPRAAVTVNEFCRSVSIGRSTFYKLVGEGRIKVMKLGERTLIKASEISRFLNDLEGGGN